MPGKLCKFICKKCKQPKMVFGGSAYFVCDDCKPANHYTFGDQYKAARAVMQAKQKGLLQPPSNFDCVDCGKKATVYDHRDYKKPLEVDPVCRSCNVRRGSAIGWQTKFFTRHMED